MRQAGNMSSAAIGLLLIAMGLIATAHAEKAGGTLRVTHRDSPASMSIHEEGTFSVIIPMMGVFNNLVLFDQHVPQNSLASIVPDLATSWSWDEDGMALTFTLRQGVKWHDGKPFTAADVRCTFELLAGRGPEKLRLNFRAAWYLSLAEVTARGDYEVTLHLKRRQPAFLAMLASGYSPIYPCHVPPREMRQHPIGTGPFKFVEYKPNQDIRVVRNPDYWKPERPFLDAIEYTIIPNRSTAILGFLAGKFDMIFPYEVTVPLAKDVKNQAPQAVCEVMPIAGRINLLLNHTAPPFNDPALRRAMALSLDRQAFIDILTEGQGDMGGILLPPPEGIWGMPQEVLRTLPGYGPDVRQRREQARDMMRQFGYAPDKHLKVTVSTRNVSLYRDPATILIDQLKEIWIDGDLETVETANWVPKLIRKDYTVAQSASGSAVDDPDPQLIENYMCNTPRDVTGYCSPELDRLILQQSMESDPAVRKEISWRIERKLIEDAVRPIIYYQRAATCRQPEVKGLTLMSNSPFNGWRMEDVWLDR
jgi:peptide/nickel transport system substrate-binding protein